MAWRPDIPEADETGKIRFELVPYTRGRGIDVGVGSFKAFPHFIGIDNNQDERLFGTPAKHADIIVPDGTELPIFASEFFDFVYSSHTLEHIKDYKKALKEWWRLIKPGGHLCLYLPHKDLYPNIGTPGYNPDHKHDFLPQDIVDAMDELGDWDLVRNEDRNEDEEYSFFQVYKKGLKGDGLCYHSWKQRAEDKRPVAAVARYGAFGDMLQSASVLPGLKAQGYHVRLFCSALGYDVVKNDPNVDSFVIQDPDQVPQFMINYYFEWMRRTFPKFVNLCETVESNFLPGERNSHFWWPKEARHEFCNKNYVEMQHMVAEVPYVFAQRFYPTIEEKLQASDRKRAAKGKVVLWSLAGSSVHKTWPGMDAIIARLMLSEAFHDTTVALVGGPECVILEGGWQHEPRVWRRAGVWPIRESLSFARVADVVIGGETGVLNSVAMEKVPKILFLSHSTVENLCRDWTNTYAIAPITAPCYPCHRIHFNFDHCPRGKNVAMTGELGKLADGPLDPERGVSLCQESIDVDTVWGILCEVLGIPLEGYHGKPGRSVQRVDPRILLPG